jgi:hypothetical protein
MAFVHGKNATTLVGEFDLSAFFNSADVAMTTDTAEVTTFGAAAKAYIPGLRDATLSLAGLFDGDAGAVDPVLQATLGGSAQLISVCVAGAGAIGNNAKLAAAHSTNYSVAAAVGDAVSISAEAQVTGGMVNGQVLANLVARTATGQTTALDNGASSANGLIAFLHLVDFSGTDIDIEIEESPDNSTWVSLVAFTQATAETAEQKTVTGAVERYLRVNITGTFTSATFAVTVARL